MSHFMTGVIRKAAALLLVVIGCVSGEAHAQTTVEYVHTDALGSPVAVTDQAGAVIDRNDYEPYGTVIGEPNYQGVGFTGHVQDAATTLTYMQQRYYDQQLGIFLSVDPVTAYSNPVGQFHRYRYANNSPYRFTDPDGRQSNETARENRASISSRSPAAQSFMKLGSGMESGSSGAQNPQVSKVASPLQAAQSAQSSPAFQDDRNTEKPGYLRRAWQAFGDVLKVGNLPLTRAGDAIDNSPAAKTAVIGAAGAAQAGTPIVKPLVERGGQYVLMYEVSVVLSAVAAGLIIPIQDMQGPDAPLNFLVPPESRRTEEAKD